MSDAEPATKAEVAVPAEPRPIMFIGGPRNGKRMADRGQTSVRTEDGIYKRVRMDAGDALGRLSFDVLAYYGWNA